ncbi:hypothetical protein [uncultured Bacteroides sp.]|jgi:hypothetical protein|uniref:hypothetical protein n=1 Tax=uncultured Bacteroides sp. TaxID=162156 RepID=UPI0025D47342|nr:hypothetical protein [uncultured Bacteroides sp.]
MENREFSRAEAWIDLLQLARFEANSTKEIINGRVIEYERGERPLSLRLLAERWKWSKNRVDKFLDLLVSERMITKRTTQGTGCGTDTGTACGTKQTIITVCNYDTYNSQSKKTGQPSGQVEGQPPGQLAGQSRDKYNKEKKEYIEKIISLFPSFAGFDLDYIAEDFADTFTAWLEYKKDRKESYKSEKSLRLCYSKLVKVSNSNPVTALQIIEDAIASNYAGFFELKNKNEYGNKKQTDSADSGDTIIRTTVL